MNTTTQTQVGDYIRICIPAYKPCGQVIPAHLSKSVYRVQGLSSPNAKHVLVSIAGRLSPVLSWVRVLSCP